MRRAASLGPVVALAVSVVGVLPAWGQDAAPAEFEVVSIKRNTSGAVANAMRTMPDGGLVIVNSAIRTFILMASPVNGSAEVEGLPDWAFTERYDVTIKPPAPVTADQRREMARRMFEGRFRLRAHVEERERDVFDLVLARADGKLGQGLKPSVADCAAEGRNGAVGPQPELTDEQVLSRCVGRDGANRIVSGAMRIEVLAASIGRRLGVRVMNRTGLTGLYSVELRFSNTLPTVEATPSEALPVLETAVREQLGLSLTKGKAKLSVLVVDHIERPSEN